MRQPKVLFASVFVFAAVAGGLIWKEMIRGTGAKAISTASLGMPDAGLVPAASEEKIFFGPEPLEQGALLEQPKPKVWKPRAKKVASAAPMSAGPATMTATMAKEPPLESGVSLGFDVGANYFIPHVRFQQALSEKLVLGIQLAYLQNVLSGPKAEMLGGGLDLAYYWRGHPLRGGFVDLGLTAYRVTTSTAFRNSFATPLSTALTVGWSGELGDAMFFTVSGGAQYVHNFNRRIGDIQFDGLMPLVRTGLGIEF